MFVFFYASANDTLYSHKTLQNILILIKYIWVYAIAIFKIITKENNPVLWYFFSAYQL